MTQLMLLNIDKFIKENKVKEVTSKRIFSTKGKIDEQGLFSEEIFGPLGSRQRKDSFGYINLRKKILHPEVYSILISASSTIKKIFEEKNKYMLKDDGSLVEIDDEHAGDNKPIISNLAQFIKYLDKINLKKLVSDKTVSTSESERKNYQSFIDRNRDLLTTSKILVLPAGYRDIIISEKTNKTLIVFSELSQMYISVLQYVSLLRDSESPYAADESEESVINQIQKTVNEINQWFKNQLKGKFGLLRHGMISKTTDYSARLPVTGDPTLDLGYVGIPWYILIKLYEPFIIHQLTTKEQSVLEMLIPNKDARTLNTIKDTLQSITSSQGKSIYPEVKEELIRIIKDIVSDKVVVYKRDPVENKDSWIAANIRVDDNSVSMKISPLDLPRTGGDFDGDTYAVFALMTRESIEEAKQKLHPRYSTTVWNKTNQLGESPYLPSNDSVVMLYHATKE